MKKKSPSRKKGTFLISTPEKLLAGLLKTGMTHEECLTWLSETVIDQVHEIWKLQTELAKYGRGEE